MGYGDQTDLFGPSGLENIFATPRDSDVKPEKKSRMAWMKRPDPAMSSTPPVWSSQLQGEQGEKSEEHEAEDYDDERLTAVAEETDAAFSEEAEGDNAQDETFQSNPFELDESALSHSRSSLRVNAAHHPMFSPERLEPTEHNMAGNRTVSGQTECEDFSPVFISKHTTMNGQVDYKAVDSHLVKKFQNMSFDSKQLSQVESKEATPCPPEQTEAQEASTFTDGLESEMLPAVPDLSLSENLPTGTPPPVTGLGGNVELRRGGYSAQSSFRDRPLSPSPSRPDSSMAREASALLSPIPTPARKHVQVRSPLREPSTPVQDEPSEAKSRSSGSPLKLFGPHDTFTSNRLWRRMSQLDPDLSAIRDEDAKSSPKVVEIVNEQTRKVSVQSFGSGELSHHRFNAEITITSASDSDKTNSDRSPGSDVPPPGARSPLMFKLETSPVLKDTFKLKRRRSAVTSAGSTIADGSTKIAHLQATTEDMANLNKAFTQPGETSLAMGKRPPNSPYKSPTPKRRRTLHASELQIDEAAVDHSYHENLQNAISSQKPTDERRLEDLREALRPRNPTPSQRRREQIEAEIREVAEQYAAEAPEELEAVMEQLEESMATDSPPSVQQQARAVANEVAKFSLRVQKASGDMTERKRSVTTQDFFNEAVMVMRLIREKAGRQSGLGSVAESEQESNSIHDDHSSRNLSALRVSRPPSREGVTSGWRPRTSEPIDARVISHLRRFQESEETEFIAQSVDSIHVEDDYVAIDEHSNIRIKGPMPQVEIVDEDSRPSSQRSNQSRSSQHSDATSTGRTLHTSSTRKSDNVGTLAPESVAHIIGQQVGNMYYDKDKQQWVKSKSPQKPTYGSFLEPPSNITSDDDPFQEISDLPVDERKEEEIRKASSQGRRLSALPSEIANPAAAPESQDFAQLNIESRATSHETVLARPVTSEGNKSRHTYSSSDPSRWTALGSSQQQTNETRATSWGDEDLYRLAAQGKLRQQPLAYAAAQVALDQRSRAASLMRQRTQESGGTPVSPHEAELSAVREDDVGDSTLNEANQESGPDISHLRENTFVEPSSPEIEVLHSPKLRRSPDKAHLSSVHCNTTRSMSLRRKTLTSRFNDADAMEQSEISFVAALPGERMMSVSLSVSRPLSERHNMGQVIKQSSSPIKYDHSHILSDLPDFTVHEEDAERPSEKALAGRLAKHASDEVNDRYALAVKDLVRTLTDVKEDDPYWDEMKQLDLHNQGVASLHGLEDFCGRMQEMDVSDNKLAYLNGAPRTLRSLYACGNMLSSLTPWTHLTNLQYLDISRNQLDSLKGLGCLIHLRELKADDNQITSLDGVLELDGLLKLRLRRNKVQAVDFGACYLQRLEELDLCSNLVTAVHNVDVLTSLAVFKLDDNPIPAFDEVHDEMRMLKYLSVRDCGLTSLNVSNMPSLQTLLADSNALSDIDGVESLKDLSLLSMRSQELANGACLSILEHAVHARTIRLSGSVMSTLHLPVSLLSLQHLELASTGLQELPQDFGLKLPNLTSLNLNFNSLKDIRPLLNIQKLEVLSVCGNRLERLRKSVATLSKIPTLTELDIRDNPLTLGHYAPLTGNICRQNDQTSLVRREQRQGDEEVDEDVLHELEIAALYCLPGADQSLDSTHYVRLDDSTKLRRRVQHLMLGYSCPKLAHLDGMKFEKKDAMVKDRIWDRLLTLGIIKKSGRVGMKGGEEE